MKLFYKYIAIMMITLIKFKMENFDTIQSIFKIVIKVEIWQECRKNFYQQPYG